MRPATYTRMQHDHKNLDLHVSHNIDKPWRSEDCFVLMKYRPVFGQQEKRKRGQVKREKSMETLRQPQLIACTTQCSKTADENMSV